MPEQKQILLVEDRENWQDTLKTLLRGEGYSVRIAASYGEALGELLRAKFDLAVVDLRLSSSTDPKNLHGQLFLVDAVERAVPVIVVTAYGRPEIVKEAFEVYGIFGYFDKRGFNLGRFKELVKEAVVGEAKPLSEELPPEQPETRRPNVQIPLQLEMKRKTIFQSVNDYYERAHLAIRKREMDHIEWLKQTYAGTINSGDVKASQERIRRDLKELDEMCQRMIERIGHAESIEDFTTMELEIIEEGKNWTSLFSRLSD